MDSRDATRQSAAMPDTTKPTDRATRDVDPLRTHGGFADLVGYTLESWEPDLAEVTLTVDARHVNRSGVMHGGMLTTLVDTACGYSGCHAPQGETPKRAFTLSLTTNFVGAAQLGQRLIARARCTGDCEVRDQDGRMIGTGQGTFKYITLRG